MESPEGVSGVRVLMVTQWFQPEPFFKGLPLARALQQRGHHVEVLTGFPNYPEGKLYPGYRVRLRMREMIDGVAIMRVPLYPSHDLSSLRRVGNYLSFALSASSIGALSVSRPDVVYVYHPPATVGLVALAMEALRRAPFVYDIQDLWPDTLASTGMVRSGFILGSVAAWCKLIYRRAKSIVVLSPGFKRTLVQRGVSADKIHVVYNWADPSIHPTEPNPGLAAQLGLSGKFNVMFAGNMGPAQHLDTVIEAAGILAVRAPQVQFVFVGGGIEVERLQRLASRMSLTNVRFLGRKAPSEVGALLALADVLVVHLKDDPLFAITIPSKTQAYLAVGKPILLAVRGDAAALVERAGAGITCPPEDPAAMATALQKMFSMRREDLVRMGMAGRSFYERELSFDRAVRQTEEVLAAARGA